MVICPNDKCTGCFACANVCPQKCISMYEDDFGELHPLVDETKCVNCDACIKTCPVNNEIIPLWPRKCYASWITDEAKRCICASGGIGTILSEFVIRHKHGIVFGTAYDRNFIPRVTYVESLDDIEQFKGSKYVQSIVSDNTYKDARKALQDGRFVLFIGTPCQIAGLKSYLKKDYENLLMVDLICHGVSPTKYFREEITYLIEKYHIKNLSDIRFRGNDSNDFALTLWNKTSGILKRCYRGKYNTDYYLCSFLLGVTLRENCYSCKYAIPERISDITIGDFIGLGKHESFPYSKKNVSSVTVNTKKAELFYRELCEKMPELRNVERRYEERLEYKPSLCYPFPRHKKTEAFREAYTKYGYVMGIRKVLRNYVIWNSISNDFSLLKMTVKRIIKKIILYEKWNKNEY